MEIYFSLYQIFFVLEFYFLLLFLSDDSEKRDDSIEDESDNLVSALVKRVLCKKEIKKTMISPYFFFRSHCVMCVHLLIYITVP